MSSNPSVEHCPDTNTHHSFLDPSAVTKPLPDALPQTGSNERGMAYMWCTPGTETFVFFSQLYLTPPPVDYYYFSAAVNASQAQYAGQTDEPIPDNEFTSDPVGSNVQVHMEGAAKGTLTWGIANSALTGLQQFYENYSDEQINNFPLIFQVNDGAWGEIAIGYVAFLRPSDGKCLLQVYQGKELECKDLGKNIV